MDLSLHFTLAEASKSQVALRLGIDNTPPDDVVPRLIDVAEHILEPCREHFGIPYSPSSWFRCRELEAEICKKTIESLLAKGRIQSADEYLDKKQHSKGECVDFEIPGVPNLELAKWIVDSLTYDQLILEYWSPTDPTAGWVHCGWVSYRPNRMEVLRYDGKDYLKGLS